MTKYDFIDLPLLKQVTVRYRCSTCALLKNKVGFGEQKARKSGVRCKCKICDAEYSRSYAKTKDGLITKIYGRQKNSSKERGYHQPTYSKSDFRDWCLNQDLFHELYKNWVDNGYEKSSVPSVDRLDDYEGYSFKNIQLTTWLENNKKGNADEISGRNRKRSKAVNQYDLDGNFLNNYHSANHASRVTGVSRTGISQSCSPTPFRQGYYKDGTIRYTSRDRAGGYLWKFA